MNQTEQMRFETDEQVPRRDLVRVVLASSAGTIFEAYDFILFGSLAPLIARKFFSGVDETQAFIFALLTFAAGFIVRPLGALIFGRMGDKGGRKQTFLITITLMGVATIAIGLLPTYETAGIIAPILLILVRLVQGLAYGGEYGGAVIYTAEHAPIGKRGLYVGWIQSAAGFALFLSLFVIDITRTSLGEEVFADWGWRVPFLLSALLLVMSLWIRFSLDESPAFRRMLAEGKVSKRPLTEAFMTWVNLRVVLMVLFGMMAVQGVLWYTSHFYTQFFLVQVLDFPEASATRVLMYVTITSVPLYVLFSWLSDRIGRKPIMLTGMILSVLTLFPAFHLLTRTVNPALEQASLAAPVVIVVQPGQCPLQFQLIGKPQYRTPCEAAQTLLSRLGIPYEVRETANSAETLLLIGSSRLVVPDVSRTPQSGREAALAPFRASIQQNLSVAGYPDAKVTGVNLLLVYGIIVALVIFSVMVYAPIPALVVEVFPARIRYSALSFPYHIGSGWFGGLLPAIAFMITAATGNLYANLWYPVGVTVVGILVMAFLLPERRKEAFELD
jgi:MFS family permease